MTPDQAAGETWRVCPTCTTGFWGKGRRDFCTLECRLEANGLERVACTCQRCGAGYVAEIARGRQPNALTLTICPACRNAAYQERAEAKRANTKPRHGPRNVERDRAIAEAYGAGADATDLASQYGLTPQTIAVIAWRLGVHRTKREPKQPLTDPRRTQCGNPKKTISGTERKRIAASYGLTVEQYAIIKAAGLTVKQFREMVIDAKEGRIPVADSQYSQVARQVSGATNSRNIA